jgi:peptidoglycan/xylan/chitin deacetylase (PgdA/CDA1 family)
VTDRLERIEWPGGARVAVTITVALELWEGPYVETGYHDGPPVSVPQELLDSGYRDNATLSWQDYGPRRGMPRLLDIVDRHEVPVTTVVSGLAAERWPDVIRAYHNSGHEICAHSWAQDVRTWKLNREQEEANIRRCSEAIRAATGQAPVGWISPSAQPSDVTAELLHREGYTWHGDCSDDDIPYFVPAGDGRLVAIPYQYDLNDLKVYVKGMNDASVYVKWFGHKFDVMYREGATAPGMVNATVHAALYGRPYGSWALEECIKYAKGHKDVWFATRSQIADWMLKEYG